TTSLRVCSCCRSHGAVSPLLPRLFRLFLSCSLPLLYLRSFPTRRSSDLIRSQVLTVFFLPLLTAGIHVAVAFPLMSRLLELLYRSEEHTSELQSRFDLVCRLLLEKKNSTGPKHYS